MLKGIKKPVRVGILCSQWQIQNRNKCHINQYVDAVTAAGGTPKLIPRQPGCPEKVILKDVDALLIPGGFDVDPVFYGGDPKPYSKDCNLQFDKFELNCIKHALKTRMPMLGICRGEQLMNVAVKGGTLIQDIPSEVNSSSDWHIQHQQRALESLNGNNKVPVHLIKVVPEIEGRPTILKSLFNMNFLPVNSAHHQAVKAVAPIFAVAAMAYDGVVEAIERKDSPNQWAVQFHPERLRLVEPIWDRIFDKLVKDGKKWRKENPDGNIAALNSVEADKSMCRCTENSARKINNL